MERLWLQGQPSGNLRLFTAGWAKHANWLSLLYLWESSFSAQRASPASHSPSQPKGRSRPRWGQHYCWLSSLKLVPSVQLEEVKFSWKFWWKLPRRQLKAAEALLPLGTWKFYLQEKKKCLERSPEIQDLEILTTRLLSFDCNKCIWGCNHFPSYFKYCGHGWSGGGWLGVTPEANNSL